MDENSKYILDRLDYLEFRQSILFLKPPQHRIQLFCDLTFEDFLEIRNYVDKYDLKIKNGELFSLNDFSKGIAKIWEPANYYPLSASLIGESLLDKDLYNKLISQPK